MTQRSGGVVAAGHRETSRAGQLMLQEGGNATDAALAAMLAACVCEPILCSLGGGGFFIGAERGRRPVLVDFFVQTPGRKLNPANLDVREHRIDFGAADQYQYFGAGTIAVPGVPAGVMNIHQHFCSLPLKVIATPAIELAAKGVALSDYQAYTLTLVEEIILSCPDTARLFGQNGKLMTAGSEVIQSQLAQTLEWLAWEGDRPFYEGEIAQRLAEDHSEIRGSLTLEDLSSYQVHQREVLRQSFRGLEMLTNPLPSNGGPLISYGLGILESNRRGFPDLPEGPEYVKLVAQALHQMNRFRREGFNSVGNTTQISVIDAKGQAAAITLTLGGVAGQVIRDTGVTLNNMLGEADLNPQGFFSWKPNTRMSSTMAPSVLWESGQPILAFGSGGSSRIRSALLQQVILRGVYGFNPAKAVAYPRVHLDHETLHIEPGLINDARELSDLPFHIRLWEDLHMYFGGVHAAGLDLRGRLSGGADIRRDGVVMEA